MSRERPRHRSREIQLLLHNLRSVANVGSIFRTADAAGVLKIFLVGITPTPVDRFGRVRKDFAKASLGAEKTVPWEYHRSAGEIIARLRKGGVSIVAVEQNTRSVDIRNFKAPARLLCMLGNEVMGLPASLVSSADTVVEIPMRGVKESLNVAVAAGIILFSILPKGKSQGNRQKIKRGMRN